ncbi:zf-HC2 domain-containing protein [Streptomyces sp. AC555_RSS877]|uniref:zf-HC2 domain-containing protein n=1 Tax=Streptomyces sp. AC555_RSS877 TaxID=2823688 RepID=UPI001C278171|nr:zf-HC2 domain-containing protein [Streptomyces sp. AC555_RSS877]
MTGWHASDDLVTRYGDGTLPEPDAWSLEKHLESCGRCAARVSRAVRATAAGVVLAEVRGAVLRAAPADVREAAPAGAASAPSGAAAAGPGPASAAGPRSTRPPAAAPTAPAASAASAPAQHTPAPSHAYARTRLRLPRHLGLPLGSRLTRVLWAAGPAVRGAWLPAVLLVAVGAVALAYGADFTGARPLLLAIAPVVPVAGVALSYGSHADPVHEIAASTPSAGLRLVLTRTAAVLAVSLPLLTLAGVLVPSSGAPGAAAWLLPGLALTLASLTLAGYVGWRAAAAVTGGGWLSAVLAPALVAPGGRLTARLSEQLAYCLDGAPAQGGWAAAAVLCAVLLAARRPAHDRLERP